VSDKDAITAKRAAMEGSVEAFNAQDAKAIRSRWFHLSHVRAHSGKITAMERPKGCHNLVWQSSGRAGK
jgi:hypothetical protein